MSSPDWPRARAQMLLDPEVTNLNTGSFCPQPRVVFERATALRQRLAAEPMDFLLRQMPPLLWEARVALARFLGADPCRLIFTVNVTVSINIVANALRLASPGEVLLTDHEYGAMHWCWERAAQRLGLTVRTFPLPTMPVSPTAIVAAMRAALNEHTRLLFFSHVLSPTGMVLPAQELCALARKHGVLTVVDGAHAPAMVSLDLDAIGADFYGGNCHKWLLGPIGSGFLHFGPGAAERLQPTHVSWGWKHDPAQCNDRDEFGTTPLLRFFECEGTRDLCAWMAVPAAIDFQTGLGWEAIRGRMAELSDHARKRIEGEIGLTLNTPPQKELHGALTAFWLPAGTDPPTLRRLLWERHHIEAPIIERPNGNMIRVSAHFYNTEAEIDRLAAVLPALIRDARA